MIVDGMNCFLYRMRAGLLIVAALLVCSCASKFDPVKAFYRGDLDAAVDAFEAAAAKRDKNYVLHSCNLGSAALTAGYYSLADRALEGAVRVMWSTAGKTRGMLSLVSAESIKVFKGEPFEKAMASFYIGLIYYKWGEYDNAAASFRKALLADRQSKEGYRDDFAVAQYMLARCYVKQGQYDNARILLAKAKKAFPNNPYFTISSIKRTNAVFILETGRVPEKYRHGPGASLDDFREIITPDVGGEVEVGDRYIGRGAVAVDLYVQAKTRGSSGKDVVQGVKGTMRTAAAVTAVAAKNKWVKLGAAFFAAADQSQADIRQWKTLPQRVAVLPARIKPGVYNMEVRFLDKHNMPISRLVQNWQGVKIPRHKDALYLFRAIPKQGGPIERKRLPKRRLKR